MLTPDQLKPCPAALCSYGSRWKISRILQDIMPGMKSGRTGPADPNGHMAGMAAGRNPRRAQQHRCHPGPVPAGKSRAEIKRLLETAGTQTLAADDATGLYGCGLDPPPVNQSPALLNLLNSGYRQDLRHLARIRLPPTR